MKRIGCMALGFLLMFALNAPAASADAGKSVKVGGAISAKEIAWNVQVGYKMGWSFNRFNFRTSLFWSPVDTLYHMGEVDTAESITRIPSFHPYGLNATLTYTLSEDIHSSFLASITQQLQRPTLSFQVTYSPEYFDYNTMRIDSVNECATVSAGFSTYVKLLKATLGGFYMVTYANPAVLPDVFDVFWGSVDAIMTRMPMGGVLTWNNFQIIGMQENYARLIPSGAMYYSQTVVSFRIKNLTRAKLFFGPTFYSRTAGTVEGVVVQTPTGWQNYFEFGAEF